MKRISILHYSAPPVVGGIESIIYHHLRLLHAAGYELRVIAGQGDAGYYEASFFHAVDFQPIPELHPLHPHVRAAHADPGGSHFADLQAYLVETLRPLLENQDICMLHNAVTTSGHLPLTAALHQLSTAGITRLAAWCHEFPDPHTPRAGSLPEALLFTPWPRVDYVVDSYQQRDKLAAVLEMPAASIWVIPSGIDTAAALKWELSVERLVNRLGLLDGDPLLLLPCCGSPEGYEELILEVLFHIRRQKEHAILLIVGLSPAEDASAVRRMEELKALRQRLGLDKAVHFLFDGDALAAELRINEAVLSDFYSMADLLFLPANADEGSYAPLVAAALARVPVFTAVSPLIAEMTGNMVQRFDPRLPPAEIAQSILAFLETNPAHQLRRTVLTHYSWDAILEEGLLPLLHGTKPVAHPHP